MALGLSNNANNKEKIFNWHLTNVNVLLFETGKVCIFYSDSEGFLTVELMWISFQLKIKNPRIGLLL